LKVEDTLSIERRLVVLGVTKMYYLQQDNDLLKSENHNLVLLNKHNVQYIAQLEGDLSAIKDIKEEQERKKRGWRTAALVSSGLFIVTLIAAL
jgi:hypothetical protein